MASKKKAKKVDPYEGLEVAALHMLLDAQDACNHMDKEMSPNARISWRERANTKVHVANAMINFLNMVKK